MLAALPRRLPWIAAGLLAFACASPPPGADLEARARAVLARVPLIDGHNDLPWRLRRRSQSSFDQFDIAVRQGEGHTDIPRLREGGIGAQFWSVYVPVTFAGDDAVRATLEQIDTVYRMLRRYPEVFERASTADDVVRIHAAGKIASMMGVEGGHCIHGSLAVLRMFHRLGVRYMTLTHSANTAWADSATDTPEHDGLSSFGEDVIREMNRLGMIVDLSHVSPAAMHDVLRVADAPVIFSHSSARALTDHPRNVPDDVLRQLPANGGVVMVTFVPSYVSRNAGDWGLREQAERRRLEAQFGRNDPRIQNGMRVWEVKNPRPTATLPDVAAHIEHIRRIAGVDHVGLGADFDGITAVVEGLEDVSKYVDLLVELLQRGWSDQDLEKLAGRNLLRVMRDVEARAQRSGD